MEDSATQPTGAVAVLRASEVDHGLPCIQTSGEPNEIAGASQGMVVQDWEVMEGHGCVLTGEKDVGYATVPGNAPASRQGGSIQVLP